MILQNLPLIFALQDASTSHSYALGRICGVLLGSALGFAIRRSLFAGGPVFSGHAKYVLAALVLVGAGIFALIQTNHAATAAVSSKPEVPASANASATPSPAPPAVQDPELSGLLAEAQKQYGTLETQRRSLDLKNTKAVKAFNAQAKAYKELLLRIEERRKALASTDIRHLQ